MTTAKAVVIDGNCNKAVVSKDGSEIEVYYEGHPWSALPDTAAYGMWLATRDLGNGKVMAGTGATIWGAIRNAKEWTVADGPVEAVQKVKMSAPVEIIGKCESCGAIVPIYEVCPCPEYPDETIEACRVCLPGFQKANGIGAGL